MEKSVSPLIIGENIILVLTFWGHSQFDSYVLFAVNLILFIFQLAVNLVSTINSLTENVYMINSVHC